MSAPTGSCAARLFLTAFATTASLAGAAEAPRFALSGAGTLAPAASVQASGRLELRAGLAAAPPGAEAARVEDGRFALTAILSAAALACSSDTIFRDAFDGTGL